MLHKTRGIVLHTIPYGDRYLIVAIYTEAFGRVGYLVIPARRGKSGIPQALLMPLSLLELEVEHRNDRDLQRIHEARSLSTLAALQTHPAKNAEALFLSEVLYRVIREKESDPPLFHYLFDAVRHLETADAGIANFHLTFLFRLTVYLGIRPNRETYAEGRYFDLIEGIFTDEVPLHGRYLSPDDSRVMARLTRMTFANMSLFSFSHRERSAILGHIIDYYRHHLPGLPEFKSLEVLRALFE